MELFLIFGVTEQAFQPLSRHACESENMNWDILKLINRLAVLYQGDMVIYRGLRRDSAVWMSLVFTPRDDASIFS